MPVKTDREYRVCQEFRALEEKEDSYIVEGYASTFEPYVLYTDGVDVINERLEPTAFDNADMSDVIFQYDHNGHVYARQSNGTLQVSVDEHGLKIRADLSKTASSREMYEEIKSGLCSQMSFAFTIARGGDCFDKETRTRVIKSVRKVYDVSAVSIPANPTTEISARSYFDGVLEAEKQERLEAEAKERENQRRRQRLRILLEVD